ncbi:ribonuclease domain-containing protein [Kutzneria viridogrisea]|uniref:Guanyl-specific ribonuclease Sa n=1 Tax=Kutzneria viridogrisea TaxID=47990 RepID=A0ABR6BL30_9PSEU|nr:guanyl-specific ribonuclease Sa [Kutzneria viridogrisea]
MTQRRRITIALIGLIVLVAAGWLVKDLSSAPSGKPASSATSTSSAASNQGSGSVPGASSGLPVKALSALPAEAGATWKLIQKGGPFPHPDNDGVVFRNNEKRLPQNKVGYYHEYTVETPGAKNRATRRLVTGSQQEVFYTEDHYESFVVVDTAK